MEDRVEQAPELTDEDEKILDRIWAEVRRDEEQRDRWSKNPPNRR